MKYKKTFMIAAISGLAISAASAVNIKLDFGSHHSGSGGEFAVTASSSGTAAQQAASAAFVSATTANYSPLAQFGGGFETFCLEYYEHFTPGSSYQSQVSPGAIKGGTATSDPVSIGTAYLYSLFAQGTLTGYNYTSSTSAKNLQETIWWLEGDLATNPSVFDALLTAEFGAASIWDDDAGVSLRTSGLVNANSYGVAALNLGGPPVWPNQDQLIYQPGGFQQVPDGGATLMLLGLAIGAIRLLKSKFE